MWYLGPAPFPSWQPALQRVASAFPSCVLLETWPTKLIAKEGKKEGNWVCPFRVEDVGRGPAILCDNKIRFVQTLQRTTAARYLPPSVILTKDAKRHTLLPFPFILKAEQGSGGKTVHLVLNYATCVQYLREYTRVVIQAVVRFRYVHSVHLYAVRGQLWHTVMYTRPVYRSTPIITRGPITNYVRDAQPVPALLSSVSAVLTALQYTGFACVDCTSDFDPEHTVTQTPNFAVYEINPRVGGSLIENTPDFIELLTAIEAYKEKN